MAIKKKEWQPPRDIEPQDSAVISEIGKKLKKLREKQGVNIYTFTENLDVSRTAYNQMESGSVYFNIRNLLVILRHHGIDLKTFVETNLEKL